jgi:ABC-type Zn uptake system ZnuABC Zn-binding protein ZnuA
MPPAVTARRVRLASVALVAVSMAGCGSSAASSSGSDAAHLVAATTVSPITSIVAAVGGDRVDVRGIVPEGTNSHTFEPTPSVAKTLAQADVIFVNGLQLEAPTVKLAEANKPSATEIVELGTLTIPPEQYIYDFSFPKDEGKPNPHLWTDPLMAKRYADIVAEKLATLDPDDKAYFEANAERFGAEVDALDAAMRTAFATVPEGQRKLLTYHDAYAYFARDYGWEVIGAIQVSDFEDPTPREVADLITQIKAESVPAIFGSEVFPSPVLAQIGREAGVTYVDKLRDDDLPGAPGDPEHSLLGLLKFNYATITKALGGDPAAIDATDVTLVSPDDATYPQ